MNEHLIVRTVLVRIARDIAPDTDAAQSLLGWVGNNGAWLFGPAWTSKPVAKKKAKDTKAEDWKHLQTCLEGTPANDEARPRILDLAEELGRLLHLEAFDARLLTLMIACDRLPRLADLLDVMEDHVRDLPAVLGELAGADRLDASARVRRSDILKLGMVSFGITARHDNPVEICWPLASVLDRDPAPEALGEALAGRRQTSHLDLHDFAHVGDAGFLVRLLSGAAKARAHGVNILIHGPPGSGKTELARVLAAAAGCPLHGIGEAGDEGKEPSRRDRVLALQLAQRILGDHSGAVLLFDEMEDLIGRRKGRAVTGSPSAKAPRSSSTGCWKATRRRSSG